MVTRKSIIMWWKVFFWVQTFHGTNTKAKSRECFSPDNQGPLSSMMSLICRRTQGNYCVGWKKYISYILKNCHEMVMAAYGISSPDTTKTFFKRNPHVQSITHSLLAFKMSTIMLTFKIIIPSLRTLMQRTPKDGNWNFNPKGRLQWPVLQSVDCCLY